MVPIIEVKDLHHRYPNGCHALRGVSVTIDRGEFVAIIGQNGSGKTTFVKHLNGLLRATTGTVDVNGQDVSKHKVSEIARVVGYCFQNPDHQIFCDTVYKEVAYGPRNLHLSQAEIEERVIEALGAVGMLHLQARMPRDLSKGQRQRLAVASVLSMRPEVLIVDEPTTGQDYRDGVDMLNLVQRLNQAGHTVLFITHDMPMVARFAHRVIVFRDGQILLDGTTQEVFGQADVLRTTFLAPPQITSLAQALPEFFPDTVLSVAEMVDQTLAMLQKRGKEVRPS
ncbi:MAG: energy-coupling factor transporter ATPase [Anaerolineales bacterium]|nr:MAG: energy-coupling factor transporter ATPase [Anaerolineales bacterium]